MISARHCAHWFTDTLVTDTSSISALFELITRAEWQCCDRRHTKSGLLATKLPELLRSRRPHLNRTGGHDAAKLADPSHNGLIVGPASRSVGANVLTLSHVSIPIRINTAAAAVNKVILLLRMPTL